MRRTGIWATGLATAALLTASLLTACSEPEPKAAGGLSKTTSDAVQTCDGKALLACARRSTIGPYVPDAPTKATGAPIELGMINQENTAAGSYPELSQAVQAGVEFINQELGGVNGRPIHVDLCNTEFSAEGSTSCGQKYVEAKVPAVLGGIDVFGNAIDTLEQNGIPYIGGIPVSTQSVTDANSFQWSGGTWGATVAFSWYAAHVLHAKKVSIVYGEFGSITDSAKVGQQVLERSGVKVQLVPYPILATDISSALNAAAATKPDALFVLAADTGCKAGFDGVSSLGITATPFYVGACASPSIVDEAGPAKTNGAIFNVEGPVGQHPPNPDFVLYSAIIEKYGKGLDPVGAGTVSFRSLMNLFSIMSQLDGAITPAAITAELKAQTGAPSFSGHDYTCDGEQFPDLPAMCSPQQILAQMHDGTLKQLGDWIDVGKIAASS
ncbi:ABC transporter substrate-binding protein [Aquihabitans sp. McL0605]|uniref:ABC transporter substrate-binding protein n=1 Tax=Aquihabitans sp. McL0605 TaxID=3415671 RepID=UPI003CEF4764